MELRPGTGATPPDAGTWTAQYLTVAAAEGHSFLNDAQYAHAVELVRQLAEEVNPRLSEALDVRPIDEFYELRDKGGVLGRINLRIYFAVFDDLRRIVVLGSIRRSRRHKPLHTL